MICEKCGYEVGPEQLKCPHCGADNPFAIKHEENMREYGKKYDATEKEVKGFGKSVEGLGKRAAILAVLLVGSIAMIIAAAIISEGPDEEAAVMALQQLIETDFKEFAS